jgi:uncharacterized protein (DUF1810 family)
MQISLHDNALLHRGLALGDFLDPSQMRRRRRKGRTDTFKNCGCLNYAATMTDSDLIRFLDAQDQIFGQVIDELSNGRKQTHCMWFIFPQLAGLGRSAMAQHYAIKDLDQAKRYLADSILGARLRQVVKMAASHHEKSACQILGSPDDLKLRSCLTLFREAASDPSDRALFSQALVQFCQGQPDEMTLALLR